MLSATQDETKQLLEGKQERIAAQQKLAELEAQVRSKFALPLSFIN